MNTITERLKNNIIYFNQNKIGKKLEQMILDNSSVFEVKKYLKKYENCVITGIKNNFGYNQLLYNKIYSKAIIYIKQNEIEKNEK